MHVIASFSDEIVVFKWLEMALDFHMKVEHFYDSFDLALQFRDLVRFQQVVLGGGLYLLENVRLILVILEVLCECYKFFYEE